MLSASHALCIPGHTFDISSLHLFKSLDNLWNKIQPTLVDLLRCLTCPGTGPSRVGPVPPMSMSMSCLARPQYEAPPASGTRGRTRGTSPSWWPTPCSPSLATRSSSSWRRGCIRATILSRAVIEKNTPKFIAGNVVGPNCLVRRKLSNVPSVLCANILLLYKIHFHCFPPLSLLILC